MTDTERRIIEALDRQTKAITALVEALRLSPPSSDDKSPTAATGEPEKGTPEPPVIQLGGWRKSPDGCSHGFPEKIWGWSPGDEWPCKYATFGTDTKLYFDTGDELQNIRQDFRPDYWMPRT